MARPPRRIDVRRPWDEHEDQLDDRVRVAPQRAAADLRRRRVRTPGDRWPRPAAAQLQGDRRDQSRAAATASTRGPSELSATEIQRRQADGALVVDVRGELEFGEAHVPGALCNPAIRAGFGTKLAWIADRDREIVLVGGDDRDAIHAAELAMAVGIRRIEGYLGGGMASWTGAELPVRALERVDVDALHARRDDVQVLDVREPREFDEGHIPGSVNVPYHDVAGVPAGIDPAQPVAVICSSGQRAAVAASLLQAGGADHVIHVSGGGVGTWRKRGWEFTQRG